MKHRYVICCSLILSFSACARSYTSSVGSISGAGVSGETGYTGGTVGTGLPGVLQGGAEGTTSAMASVLWGIIEDENGMPIAGARILIETSDSIREVVSDRAGRFRLNAVIGNSILSFSLKAGDKGEKLPIRYDAKRVIRVVVDRNGKLREGFNNE